MDLPQYSIILIDEIESSLHPRAQQRVIRDLAERCREREWQIILTRHSPYVLAELPPQARAYIMQMGAAREIVCGVSPEFAMTRMDDVAQPECDLYVEDPRAQVLCSEVLVAHASHLVQRCQIIPYGAASVGRALGHMVQGDRFPRPSRIFLDGDQAAAPGCIRLPGDDAPERVVFESAKTTNWSGIAERVGRTFSNVAYACSRAMLRGDHHEWVDAAATALILRGDILWQAMCAEWAKNLAPPKAIKITQPVEDALIGVPPHEGAAVPAAAGLPGQVAPETRPKVVASKAKTSSIEPAPLFRAIVARS